ncbi:hypothetical protein P7C73_g1086, partial [Tremellales sp. Uapishka_1]
MRSHIILTLLSLPAILAATITVTASTSTVTHPIQTKRQNALSIISDITSGVGAATSAIPSIISDVTSVGGDVTSGGASLLTQITSEGASALTALTSAAESIATAVTSGAAGALSSVTSAAGDVTSAAESAASEVTSIAPGLASSAKSDVSSIKSAATSLISSVSGAATSIASSASASASAKASSAGSTLDKNLGWSMVLGMAAVHEAQRPLNVVASDPRSESQKARKLVQLRPDDHNPFRGDADEEEAEEVAANEEEWDEGCFVGLELGTEKSGRRKTDECFVRRLPDELLVQVFSHLPPTPLQLCTLSLVSTRFYTAAQSPLLWSEAFFSHPGFRLTPEAVAKSVATTIPPGRWENETFISQPATSPPSPSWFGRARSNSLLPLPVPTTTKIHYPTLYRSRLALVSQLKSPVSPASLHTSVLTKHLDSVYAVEIQGDYLITGSRDRSIKIWKLPDLMDTAGVGKTKLWKSIAGAHEGSVLSIKFEIGSGMMVSGSSDCTAGVWAIDWENNARKVESVGRLKGHTGGVLDVGLGLERIVTCSKDTTIRIYERETLSHLHTLSPHTGPVNCLALHPDASVAHVVSASGNGSFIVWDMNTGAEVRRGTGDGRGLACVVWKGDYILTGSVDRSIKLFSATSTALLRTFEGHTDLVRTLAMDPELGIIVSGSYDHTINIWDFNTGELIRKLPFNHASLIFDIKLTPTRLISASHDKLVHVTTFGVGLPYLGLFA